MNTLKMINLKTRKFIEKSDLVKVKLILDSLTEKEKSYVGEKLSFDNLVSLQIAYSDKNLPIGFLATKDCSEKEVSAIYCIMAINKEFRNSGISQKLMKQLVNWFLDSNYEQLIYICAKENVASRKFIKKCGFSFGWIKSETGEEVYLITNFSKIKGLLENY